MSLFSKDRMREFNTQVRSFFETFREARVDRTLFVIFIFMLAGGFIVWLIEGKETFPTPFDALWWAIVTMTTVGYGDYYPTQVMGKLAAMGVIMAGMAMVSLFTASISSVLVSMKIREGKGLQQVHYSDHIVLCGWYGGASSVVDALGELASGKIKLVFVNELSPTKIEELMERYKNFDPKYVRGDSSHEVVLKRAGVDQARVVILLPDMIEDATPAQIDQRTILAALGVKELNNKVKVYAYALDRESVPHMRRGGVDKVVLRDAYAGYLLACHAMAPGIPEVVEELLTYQSGNRFLRIRIPNEFEGKPVWEVAQMFRSKLNSMMIGLISEEKVIEVEDILSNDLSSIDAFIKRKFEESGRSADELARTRIKINPDPDRLIEKGELAIVIQQVGSDSDE